MLLVFHILAALSSLVCSAFAFFGPSIFRLRFSYLLSVFTLISGTYLVMSTHANMVSACISGLVYLGFVTSMLLLARAKIESNSS
jgi:hypothetical protein